MAATPEVPRAREAQGAPFHNHYDLERKASEPSIGDVFRLHIFGEVVAVAPVVGGKRIKVRIALED